MRYLIFYVIIICASCDTRNSLIEADENLIFSFETNKGLSIILAEDTLKKAILFRYGKEGDIQIEFPYHKENSYSKFRFASGFDTLALKEFNYIQFRDKGYLYRICDEYYSTGNIRKVFLRVYDCKAGEVNDFVGKPNASKGGLEVFRNNGKLEKLRVDKLDHECS